MNKSYLTAILTVFLVGITASASVPEVVHIKGTMSLDKILLDGSDPGVFQCLNCSFDAVFQAFSDTGSKNIVLYRSEATLTDATNNPLQPSMSLSVTDPTSYFSQFVQLQVNPAKDEALFVLQTSGGFNANPLGYHFVAVAVTTTIQNFSKAVLNGELPVSLQEGVWSLNGLDQNMGAFPGQIQLNFTPAE